MRYLHYLAGLTSSLPIVITLFISLFISLCLPSASVQAAVTTYTLTSNNSYIRERNDISSGLPLVIDARTSISGQFTVDTVTGELISATLVLDDYSEDYDWNPFALPWLPDGSAALNYTGETQSLTGGIFGDVNGAVISYSGANAWSGASTLGSVSCTTSSGTLGDDVCNNATITPWGSFDVDLAFSNGFIMASVNTWWIDSDSLTENTHQLQMFAVATVPIPAAGWLMMSALIGLGAVAKK